MKNHYMKILISENQFNAILKSSDVINEQQDQGVDEKKTLQNLENKINGIIQKKQVDILNTVKFKLIGESSTGEERKIPDTYTLQLISSATNKILSTFKLPTTYPNTYEARLAPGELLKLANFNMDVIDAEIKEIPEYQTLSQTHPEIIDQIKKSVISATLYTDQNGGGFKFMLFDVRREQDKKRKSTILQNLNRAIKFPQADGKELGDFLAKGQNKAVYRFTESIYGILETSNVTTDLTDLALNFTPSQASTTAPPEVVVNLLELENIFEFDKTNFLNVNEVNQKIKTYIDEINGNIQKYGQVFINGFIKANPIVYGYSSIDADPSKVITGTAPGCNTTGTRQNYDLCLSSSRAKIVADMINKSLPVQKYPQLTNAVKYKGMGETTEFGGANSGWKPGITTPPPNAEKNRRFTIPAIRIKLR